MYDNLIIGVDGRQGGLDAAALGALLAAPGSRRHLVFVAGPPHHHGRGSAADLHLELVDPDCLPELMGRERRLVGGDAATLRIVADSVADGLQAAAMQCEADVVVVGASLHHLIPHLGGDRDVASLLNYTSETIAVAPAGYGKGPPPLRRIGVAVDGSPESLVALAHAALLAEARGCEVLARHVVEPDGDIRVPIVPAPGRNAVADPGSAAASRERMLGVPVETVTGSLHRRLVDLSRDVDLLVCGSRRNGVIRRLLLGSTSTYLSDHVAIPLIVAPPVDSAMVSRWGDHQRRSEARATP